MSTSITSLSSGALADEVRAGLTTPPRPCLDCTHDHCICEERKVKGGAALAQLEARLEQAEQERGEVYAAYTVEHGQAVEALRDLAACEHARDQALAALRYIKQRYGPLDGVGWNRLTGDET